MKLRLVVLTEGNNKGKVLDITLAQFVVGRDPQCQLRPASPLISKRHCALVKRDSQAFLEDFDSTNGTFVNDEPIKGEVELHDGDKLKIGPLYFEVKIELGVAVDKPTPVSSTKTPAPAAAKSSTPSKPAKPAAKPAPSKASEEDEIAALLFGDDDDGGKPSQDNVPEGSTIMDLTAMQAKEAADREAAHAADAAKAAEKPKASQGDTRSAAESILKKYMKRPRA